MATSTQQTLNSPVEFDLNGTFAGYWAAALRIVTGYWFLHAGVTKFAFVAGEPFDASGWMLNATGGSPIHGFFVWAAGMPWLV